MVQTRVTKKKTALAIQTIKRNTRYGDLNPDLNQQKIAKEKQS